MAEKKRKPAATPPPAKAATPGTLVNVITGLANFAVRLQRFFWDALGIFLIALALMTVLAMLMPSLVEGTLLLAWSGMLRVWLGWGGLLVAIGLAVLGLMVLRMRSNSKPTGQEDSAPPYTRVRWGRVLALELAGFTALALLALSSEGSLERAEAGLDGGRVGWGLAELLGAPMASLGMQDPLWMLLILTAFLLLLLAYGLGLLAPFGIEFRKALAKWLDSSHPGDLPEKTPGVAIAPVAAGQAEADTTFTPGRSVKKKPSGLPVEIKKRFHIPTSEERSSPPPPRAEHLPPLDLLVNEAGARPSERDINQTAGQIEKTLAEFGIPAKVIGFRVGPTVTQFAVEPGFLEKGGTEEDPVKQKVRVAQIASLQRDLTLALAAERLRIEAPVPGRPYVGIEVPNVRTTIVRLRPLLESEAFYKIDSPLAIALGRDVSGRPVVADLANMPHLLIAGTTGSGKSVCIAALTACLVMNNTPEDLRLVMIDPKMVELIRFNGLPHLYGKVETDLQRILGVLRWVVVEMDRRYKILEESHSRHIDSYNRKARRRRGLELLPRIVVMIDELADLMMTSPDQTEPALIRLAQMARAVGIHLVVATQRPSTDVVTGLIKANFPARISFAVASSIDSRVILDTVGAESLLGHGDMLFLPPEASAPLRSQGVMVSDQEVEKVITFWQGAVPTPPEALPPWEALLEEEHFLADRDQLIEKAISVVRETQRASASLLQRRLHIGYPRAARLIDELEELGIVGPPTSGGREREVLIAAQDEEGD